MRSTRTGTGGVLQQAGMFVGPPRWVQSPGQRRRLRAQTEGRADRDGDCVRRRGPAEPAVPSATKISLAGPRTEPRRVAPAHRPAPRRSPGPGEPGWRCGPGAVPRRRVGAGAAAAAAARYEARRGRPRFCSPDRKPLLLPDVVRAQVAGRGDSPFPRSPVKCGSDSSVPGVCPARPRGLGRLPAPRVPPVTSPAVTRRGRGRRRRHGGPPRRHGKPSIPARLDGTGAPLVDSRTPCSTARRPPFSGVARPSRGSSCRNSSSPSATTTRVLVTSPACRIRHRRDRREVCDHAPRGLPPRPAAVRAPPGAAGPRLPGTDRRRPVSTRGPARRGRDSTSAVRCPPDRADPSGPDPPGVEGVELPAPSRAVLDVAAYGGRWLTSRVPEPARADGTCRLAHRGGGPSHRGSGGARAGI
jgi:hypothetical protein